LKTEGGGAGSCSSSTSSCRLLTDKIVSVQNFKFALKFYKNKGFPVPHFCIFGRKIFEKKKNSTDKNIGKNCLLVMMLLDCFSR